MDAAGRPMPVRPRPGRPARPGRARPLAPALAALLGLLVPGPAAARPARLEVYLALGEAGAVRVEGRALAGDPLPAEEAGDWALVNALRTVLAVASNEIPDAEVEIAPVDRDAGPAVRATTDGEGFFAATVAAGRAAGRRAGKLPLRVRLDAPGWEADEVRVDATVLPADGSVVVVTDFDDTLAQSYVASPLLFAAQAVLANGAQVEAVPGAAACLGRLATEAQASVVLSGAPVNFHERLATFLRAHGFPPAWFVLRDFGVGPEADPLDVGAFKAAQLERLAALLPHARLVLLGDSVERDAAVYAAFREAHPERVARILIREARGGRTPAAAPAPGVETFRRYEDLRCTAAGTAGGAPAD